MNSQIYSDTIETSEVREAVQKISRYDYIVFSSTNGVESFFRALKRYGLDTRALAGIKIACIGPVTSEALERHGIVSDVTAQQFTAEGLLETLIETSPVKGLRFLLVRSDIGRTVLREELVKAGARVDQAAFYSTRHVPVSPYIIKLIKSGGIDIITFTSSSTVKSFFAGIAPEELGGTVKVASIGPQTSKTLKNYNRTPDIKTKEYTTAGLVQAIFDDCCLKYNS